MNTTPFNSPLHDVRVRMSAQAVLLLSPSGRIYEQTGEIQGLDYKAAGVLLAQIMLAFQHLITGGKEGTIFFAYQDSHYHYAGTGNYKQPFLISIYHAHLHQPPLLGTIKYCIQQAYTSLNPANLRPGTGRLRLPDALSLHDALEAHYVDQPGQHDPELQNALEQIARELNTRLVLAIDESGAVAASTGNTRLLDVAHLGALAASSLSAFAELEHMTTPTATDDMAMVIIEGPRATILLARGNGPYTFLMLLPPKGTLGMGRILMKDLLQREWQVAQAYWEEADLPLEIDDDALTNFWDT